jgi:uncharacterized protein
MPPQQRGAAFFLCLFWICVTGAGAEPSFPSLSGRVVDEAGIINSQSRSRIEAKLQQLEEKTTTQAVVVTLKSLQGYDISDYGYRLGRHWGIGRAGKNNGALMIVAPTERRVRIEVGYGLEGTMTDAISRLIIENAILPRFRAGDFTGGIERGVDDMVQVLSGDAEDFKRRAAEQRGRPGTSQGIGSFGLVLLVLFIWLLFFIRRRRGQASATRTRPGWVWLPPVGGWSGSRSSGGWSSGSGGGFSGGGGSFGGGGASGSW